MDALIPNFWYNMGSRLCTVKAFATLILLYASFRFIRYTISYFRWFNLYKECRGVNRYSFLTGSLKLFLVEFEEQALMERDWMSRFPKYYRLWTGPFFPVIKVYHPDTIRKILKSSEPKPRGRLRTYEAFVPWLGEGVLIAGGQRWARTRRLITPAFRFEILKPYVVIINERVDIMLEKIDKHAKDGTSFDLFNMISLCTFDILLRCILSVEENIQNGEGHLYVNAVNDILNLIVAKARSPFFTFKVIYEHTANGKRFFQLCDLVHQWAEDIISKRRSQLEKEGPPKSRYLDFLDILMSARDEDGNGLTLLEMRTEVDNILFGGFDTTTSGISWTLYSLASIPEIQTRLQDELDSVIGDRKSKHITWEDMPKLEYLSRCVKEGNRFHSPVPSIRRQLENPIELEGKVIPVGTVIMIAIWNLHHNPEVWEDPDKFDPDRFLPENTRNRDHFAYVPFSAGPRNCLGQHFAFNEERLIIGRILERFRLEPDQRIKAKRKCSAVMESTDGLWVYAKRRLQ